MMALEDAIRYSEDVEVCEFKVEHFYAKGVYMRVLHIPANHVLTGEIHRETSTNILAKGKIAISASTGDRVMEAPEYFVTQPGEKKAGYALEDTIWINVFPNEDDCEEPDVLVERLCYTAGYAQLECETQEQLDFFED